MSTFVVPELVTTDFPSDFDVLVTPYFLTNYSLADPIKTDAAHFQMHVGFYDYFTPYEIAILQTDTAPPQYINSGRMFMTSSGVEVNIRMERLTDNKPDPQLGAMEREIIRIAVQCRPNNITGIKSIVYDGGGRIYQAIDDHSTTDWRCVVRLRVLYQKADIS